MVYLLVSIIIVGIVCCPCTACICSLDNTQQYERENRRLREMLRLREITIQQLGEPAHPVSIHTPFSPRSRQYTNTELVESSIAPRVENGNHTQMNIDFSDINHHNTSTNNNEVQQENTPISSSSMHAPKTSISPSTNVELIVI